MKTLTHTGLPFSLAVAGGDTEVLTSKLSVPTGARLVGAVRASKALTLNVYQNAAVISGATVFLKNTTVSISASSAEGGGTPVDVPLTGDLIKITLANAGTPTTDDTTAYVSLFFKDTFAEPQVGGLTAANLPTAIDAAKISSGDVSNTEFDYLNGVTSAIQTQISARALPAAFTDGITADSGSSQGDGAQTIASGVLRATFVIETCATTGDAITLPAGVAGTEVIVINNGAESADVFPASGGDLGGGTDTAVAVASGGIAKWTALSATVYHPHQ